MCYLQAMQAPLPPFLRAPPSLEWPSLLPCQALCRTLWYFRISSLISSSLPLLNFCGLQMTYSFLYHVRINKKGSVSIQGLTWGLLIIVAYGNWAHTTCWALGQVLWELSLRHVLAIAPRMPTVLQVKELLMSPGVSFPPSTSADSSSTSAQMPLWL